MKKKQTIVVVQAGWVFIGHVTEVTAEHVRIEDASVIRSWGTTKGLGEIALQGPTKDTVLDPCGTVSVPKSALLFTLECR